MAFTATQNTDTTHARAAFGIGGGIKFQLMTYTCLASDTSGTITASSLAEVYGVQTDGQITLTAAPTFATNAATLAFVTNAQAAYSGTCSAARTGLNGALYYDASGNLFTVGTAFSNTVNVPQVQSDSGVAPTTLFLSAGMSSTSSATLTFSAVTAPTVYGNVIVWGV